MWVIETMNSVRPYYHGKGTLQLLNTYDPPCHRQSVLFSVEALPRGTYATAAAAVAGRSDRVH